MGNDNSNYNVQEIIDGWIDQDTNRIVNFLSQLVQCETPSPPGNTTSAMTLIRAFLDGEGLLHKAVDFDETMPNLIASTIMPEAGKHLMLNGHLDVLPAGQEPGWTDDPWSGKVADGRVWGRGTADMKAGVTAMLFAYTYLARLREGLKGRVSLTLVSDEETGFGRGTGFMFDQINQEMDADCVLTAEPSGTEAVVFASKGYMQFSVRIVTRGAISGYPNESGSAIHIAADIIRDLHALEKIAVDLPASMAAMLAVPEWRARHDQLAGPGSAEVMPRVTLNVGTIAGGSSASVIAPDCVLSATVVVPAGTDPYDVYATARDIVERYPEATFEWEGAASADVSDPSHEMALILQDTVEGLGRVRPEMTPAIAISDCRYWRYRGTPAFWYGPDGSLCSAANESVSIEELLHIVRTYVLAAIRYLTVDSALAATGREVDKPMLAPAPEVRSLPAIRVAQATTTVATFDEAGKAISSLTDRLYQRLTDAGVTVGEMSLAMFERRKRRVSVTVAFPIDPTVAADDGYEIVILPAVEVASMVHRGSPDTSTTSWNELYRWIKKQGYRAAGAYREVYIIGAPNPQHLWATELQQAIIR